MQKKVSVIVPVYNSAAYLDAFMESILGQTMPKEDYEVILVDDGSPDDSGKILDDYASRFDFMQVIHQPNAGPAAARNAGLHRATGEYVAFVDPDDILEDKYLDAAYVQASKSGADIVLFDAYRETVVTNNEKNDGVGAGISVKREMNPHAEYGFYTDDVEYIRSMQRQIIYPYMAAKVADMTFHKNVPLAAPWDKLYRREFLMSNHITFPEELRVLDDMCFNFMAFGAVGSIIYFPAFLYHYKIADTSITNSYRPDRIIQDKKVFDFLRNEIARLPQEDERTMTASEIAHFNQALYARIIKSFAIAMRLYFFNPNNPKSEQEIQAEVRQCIDSAPYQNAFKSIRLHNLEHKLVAVTLACRIKALWALELMYRLEYREP